MAPCTVELHRRGALEVPAVVQAGERVLAGEPLHLGEEAGVLEGDGGLGGERPGESLLVGRERLVPGAPQIDRADLAAEHRERRAQAGHARDTARALLDPVMSAEGRGLRHPFGAAAREVDGARLARHQLAQVVDEASGDLLGVESRRERHERVAQRLGLVPCPPLGRRGALQLQPLVVELPALLLDDPLRLESCLALAIEPSSQDLFRVHARAYLARRVNTVPPLPGSSSRVSSSSSPKCSTHARMSPSARSGTSVCER